MGFGAQGQSREEAWAQRYDGPAGESEWAHQIALDPSGNVIVTGPSRGLGTESDFATIKYSSAGVPLWTNRYDGPAHGWEASPKLAVDTSGNVIVSGESPSPSRSRDNVTIKYSSAGVPLWTNHCKGSLYSGGAWHLVLDGSGAAIVAGAVPSANPVGTTDWGTFKFSSAGELLWTKLYNGPGPESLAKDEPSDIAVDASNNVIVTGRSIGIDTEDDFATIKYSSAGVPLWTNRYDNGRSADAAFAVAVDAWDNVIVAGVSSPLGTGHYVTIKYSSAGACLWTRHYSGPGNGSGMPTAMAVDSRGNVYVTGFSARSPSDAWLVTWDWATVAYSSAGVPLWTNRLNGPGDNIDMAAAIAVDPWDHVLVAGFVTDATGLSKLAVVAYSSAGEVLWMNSSSYQGRASAITVDGAGIMFITGFVEDLSRDYITLKYMPSAMPPLITCPPLGHTNLVGTTAQFTVETAGSTPLSYRWRKDGADLVDGVNLSGATTTNLLISNVQLADAGDYTVLVTNAWGSTTSAVARLTVTPPASPGRFRNLAYSPALGLSFIFCDATVGQPYRIQTSSSLSEESWVDWQNLTYSGPAPLSDKVPGAERRFYRAVSP